MTPDIRRQILAGIITSILIVVLLVAAGCSGTAGQTASPSTALEKNISSITSAPQYAHASWGLIVIDPSTNRTLYEKNADEMFAPASTTKLFSSSAVRAIDKIAHRVYPQAFGFRLPGDSQTDEALPAAQVQHFHFSTRPQLFYDFRKPRRPRSHFGEIMEDVGEKRQKP